MTPDNDYEYERCSRIAGPLVEAQEDGSYRVGYRRLEGSRPVRSSLLVLAALLFVGGFLAWLMLPAHWPRQGDDTLVNAASIAMTVTTAIIGWFAFLNVATLCRATLLARDPVPVRPAGGHRVAFLTTIVPQAESLDLVRPTLEAALRIRYEQPIDVWLLDEGDDDEVKRMCAELGVNHFTRRGVERWNQPSGPHKAKTKHGNYNAWIDAHGERYDFMLGVDPDHVPMPIFAERFLGYFRDPDVAFVVGPQVYGNYEGFVVQAAESQQFLFHSLLQRAGNRSRTAMLVGTNNALRVSALRQIGGFQDSITEDMATSLVVHGTRNPSSGQRWTSVYTPDVVAVGEGPTSFTDYFSQQDRWSRGTDEVLARRFLRLAPRLSPRALVHYLLLTCYYPTAAIAWVLGAVNAILYFTLGAGGVVVPAHLWLMLYVDAAALQVGLYFFNRRHNVSPHEKKGSAGVAGMLISALSAPIYAASLAAVMLRRTGGFVTTPKGDASTRDSIVTFRKHLLWATVFGVPLALSFALGHHHTSMRAWSVASIVVCLLPVAIWRVSLARGRRAAAPSRVREQVAVVAQPVAAVAEAAQPAVDELAAAKLVAERERAAAEAAAQREAQQREAELAEARRRRAAESRAARRAAEELAARRAAEEAAQRRAAAEAAKRQAAEELAARRAAEEAAKRREAEELAARRAAEELAARRAAEELAARRAAEEAAKRREAEELAARRAAEELAAQAREAQARRKAEAAARREAVEAARRLAEERAARKRAEELEAQERAERLRAAEKAKPVPREKPVRRERSEPGRRDHLKPVPDQPREPARRERLKPAAEHHDRRKRHEFVRFDRRSPADRRQAARTLRRDGEERRLHRLASPAPVEANAGGKRHVVIKFGPGDQLRRGAPTEHERPGHEDPDLSWQLFDQAEA